MCSVWLVTSHSLDSDLNSLKIKPVFQELIPDGRIVHIEDVMLSVGEVGLSISVLTDGRWETVTSAPRVAIVRLHTVEVQNDEHITFLRQLELMGTRIINPISGILACLNKFWHLQELAKAGLPVALTVTTPIANQLDRAVGFVRKESGLSFPLVSKSVRGNKGNAVFLVQNEELLDDLRGVLNQKTPYIYQQYIGTSHGRDMRVIVIGGKVIGGMIRQCNTGRMQSNLAQGGSCVAIKTVSPKVEQIALACARILNLDVVGVDLLFGEGQDEYVIAEVNNNVGFVGFDSSHGIEVARILVEYARELAANLAKAESTNLESNGISVPSV